MKIITLLISTLLITTTSFAMLPNHTSLQLTLVNHTNDAFEFTGIKGQNPSNTFSINKTEIPPQGSAVITGTIRPDADLAGEIHFSTAEAQDNVLIILDPRNMHIVQPVFSLKNKSFHSVLRSKTFGDPSEPRGLRISEATVELEQVVL